MKLTLRLFVIVVAIAASLHAQDISGIWQASIGNAKEHHRLILQIDKDLGSTAKLYLIDDSPDGFLLSSFSQRGTQISFDLPDLKISYKGTVSSDGNSMDG